MLYLFAKLIAKDSEQEIEHLETLLLAFIDIKKARRSEEFNEIENIFEQLKSISNHFSI